MKRIILYIACSLDGFVADKNGGVDWLVGDGSDEKNAGSYQEFFDSVDDVILGYTTYNQIKTQLAPDNWPYEGKKSYVLTTKNLKDEKNIFFVNQDLSVFINSLKKQDGKDVWVCGGASIAKQLIEKNLVDKIIISVIPTILGEGISLFAGISEQKKLKLVETRNYNGIVDLVYKQR